MTRGFVYFGAFCLIVSAALVAAVRSEDPTPEAPVAESLTVGLRDWACPSGTVGRTTCMYVSVPENYDDPEIKQIELFVAVIAPPLPSGDAPIVFLGSQLGGSTVGSFGDWNVVARQTGRPIVLVDLRGSGLSRPQLDCGGRLSSLPWLEAQLRGQELQAAKNEVEVALRACQSGLADTIDLSGYSLEAVALDVDLIRQRLDLDSWVIGAGGEATIVARRIEQLAPDSVESLVLLGATASTADRHVAQYRYAQEVLDAVLDEGQQTLLGDAVDSLSNRTIEFAVGSGGRTRRVAVAEEVVRPVLARAVADERVRDLLPALLTERFPAGQWRLIASLRNTQYRANGSWSAGLALSVLCGDASIAAAAPLSETVDDFDRTWLGLIDDPTLEPEFCKVWDVPRHSSIVDAPGAPTLVINGELDVAAPSSAAAEIADSWRDARVITLPDTGQPPIFDGCVIELLTAFLESPGSNPGASCV